MFRRLYLEYIDPPTAAMVVAVKKRGPKTGKETDPVTP
jgi:hypothetical protein